MREAGYPFKSHDASARDIGFGMLVLHYLKVLEGEQRKEPS